MQDILARTSRVHLSLSFPGPEETGEIVRGRITRSASHDNIPIILVGLSNQKASKEQKKKRGRHRSTIRQERFAVHTEVAERAAHVAHRDRAHPNSARLDQTLKDSSSGTSIGPAALREQVRNRPNIHDRPEEREELGVPGSCSGSSRRSWDPCSVASDVDHRDRQGISVRSGNFRFSFEHPRPHGNEAASRAGPNIKELVAEANCCGGLLVGMFRFLPGSRSFRRRRRIDVRQGAPGGPGLDRGPECRSPGPFHYMHVVKQQKAFPPKRRTSNRSEIGPAGNRAISISADCCRFRP